MTIENTIIKFDAQWKEIITELFEDFVLFFMPDLYPAIDFTKGYQSLEQEFDSLFPDSDIGDKRNDKLVKVFLKNGQEQWLLVHIEVQGYYDKEFAKRMFTYFYRIYDKYDKPIVAIAIFTDHIKSFKPSSFSYQAYKTEIKYKYRIYKVLEQTEATLLRKKRNPFALAILAQFYLLQTENTAFDEILKYKRLLIRVMFSAGYEKNKIASLLIFIDNLLSLPKDLELEFKQELSLYTNNIQTMPLTWENSNLVQAIIWEESQKANLIGKQVGKQEGKQETVQELIVRFFSIFHIPIDKISEYLCVDEMFIITTLNKHGLLKRD